MEYQSARKLIPLALLSLLAGVLNALLGAGGGVVLILAIQLYYGDKKVKNSFAITNLAVMVFSLISLFSYIEGGMLHAKECLPYVFPALAGGTIGALLLGRIKTRYLKLIFASLMLYSGVKMIL
jgi:uncharacterized membrane protein YfcA